MTTVNMTSWNRRIRDCIRMLIENQGIWIRIKDHEFMIESAQGRARFYRDGKQVNESSLLFSNVVDMVREELLRSLQ